MRRTDEAEVAVVLKQDDAAAWQVSTRSKGAVDVGRGLRRARRRRPPLRRRLHLDDDVSRTTMARFRALLAGHGPEGA